MNPSQMPTNMDDETPMRVPNEDLSKRAWWIAEVRDHLEVFIFAGDFKPIDIFSIAGRDAPKLGTQFLFVDRLVRLVPTVVQDDKGRQHQTHAIVDFKKGAYVRTDTIMLIRQLDTDDPEYVSIMGKINPPKIIKPSTGDVIATKG